MRSRAAAPVLLATALLAGAARVPAQTPPPVPAVPAVQAAPAAPVTPPPRPLEQAVMEHLCRVPGQAMATPEVYEACLALQLATLRSEFGVDLQKLPASERRAIDKACTALRTERGRDAYVACLSDRLTKVMIARGHQPPTLAPVTPPVEPVLAAAVPSAISAPVPPPAAAGGAMRWVLGGLLVALLAAGGAWVLSNRHARPAMVLCRVCGEVAQSGDMCAQCRREAAEAQRRAAAERSEQDHALSEAAQRAQEEAEQQDQQARAAAVLAAEAEQRRVQEAARQAQLEREQESARRREADRRRWEEAAAAAIVEAPPDDPYVILGLTPGATAEQIAAAYKEAVEKYAAENVAHLGSELQDHYRKKAAAVERAHEQLTGASVNMSQA